MSNEAGSRAYHENEQRFRDALTATQAQTGFSARLIEKDYYCSLVLSYLATYFEQNLVFKGGTCLSKVHTQFFRLSEDLDFAVSLSPNSPRGERRRQILPLRTHLDAVGGQLPCFSVTETLSSHFRERQFNGKLAYRSIVTGESETIKVEVSLREEILLPTERLPARSILRDPFTGDPAMPHVEVRALCLLESYAEKIRAALSRRQPAIRDFFDLDHALVYKLIDPRDQKLVELVSAKLSIDAEQLVDLSAERRSLLIDQVEAELRPVLRASDFEAFDLIRVVAALEEMVQLLPPRGPMPGSAMPGSEQ
jgi:predicted nucleotidyltransferase component of viral defense system